MNVLLAQTRSEIVLAFRRGESLLLTMGIPLGLLVFFSLVDVLPQSSASTSGKAVDTLAPGIIALAVMSTAFTGLAISTGFERSYGLLKLFGSTPLGRGRLVAAKVLSVLAIQLVQFALIVGLSLALGWSPGSNWLGALAAVVLGTSGFCGLALLMAGRLRGEITLAAANGLYLVLLMVSGMLIPLDQLPTGLRAVARLLPSGALVDAISGTIGFAESVPARAWIVLVAWAVVLPLAAARTFRWHER
jgi:ABC-2 type transport system permease protein